MKETMQFLRELAANNTREWLAANETRFKAVKARRDEFAREFIDLVAQVDPRAASLRPSDVTYRFYRDTRFSHDKTPYKTHIGIFVNPPHGKKAVTSGYYLHLEPGNVMVGGGNYALPTPLLGFIRREIRDNIEEYVSIVESPEFRHHFDRVGEEWLKTAPKGFERDWKYIDYVRPKDFGVMMHLPDDYFDRPGALATLLPAMRQMKRLNDFINFSIEESGQPLLRTR